MSFQHLPHSPLALFLLFVLSSSSLGSDVLDLTDSTFKDGVADKDIILVEFYAPWCGHCKRLAPEYEIAAKALKDNDPPLSLAKVDCVGEGKEICSKHEVSGYPTLKIFRNGEFSQEYDGPRDAAGIVAYMKKHSGPAAVELKDHEHLEKKVSDAKEVLVVGFFAAGSALGKSFMKTADSKRNDYSFAFTNDAAVMEKAGHKDTVVLYRPKHFQAKFEDLTVALTEQAPTSEEILAFIRKNEAGLVGQIIPIKDMNFKRPLVVVYYQLDWVRNLKGSRYWRNRVARVAKNFVDKCTFAVAAKKDYNNKINEWGWNVDDETVHAVAYDYKGSIYKMMERFTVENLAEFAGEFVEGKLKPYIKSEAIPESNEGPVKVVVGESFNEIVRDPTKDVLIEFYAPWCGHCKQLTPIYEELGEKLAEAEDIVIAKMDATANDAPPEYEITGFPTLFWVPMGNKEKPLKYQGGRQVEDFLTYIREHATNKDTLKVITPEKKSKKKKKTEEEGKEEL